jgi:hypothetical protein
LHACLACFIAELHTEGSKARSKKTKASPSEARLLRRQAKKAIKARRSKNALLPAVGGKQASKSGGYKAIKRENKSAEYLIK